MSNVPARHSIPWEAMPGLRMHLTVRRILLHIPLFCVALLACWAWYGVAPIRSALLVAFLAAAQWGIGHLASGLILPGQKRLAQWLAMANARIPAAPLADFERAVRFNMEAAVASRRDLLSLGGKEHIIVTPDGVDIDAIVFGHEHAERRDRGCLIYAGGNMELLALNRTWAAWSRKHRVTVCLFDYRGVGASGGTASRSGCVIDTASAIAFAHTVLGFPQERILVFGHSIGGAFSAEAAPFFPHIAVVNDRSFGRLSEVAWHTLAPGYADGTALAARLVRAAISTAVRYVACWELDAGEAWLRIPTWRKAIISHRLDGIIPLPTQLEAHLAAWHGFLPPGAHVLGGGRNYAAQAARLGFSPACYGLGACIGMSGGAGAEAHNRAMSVAEEERFFRLCVEPLLGYSPTPGAAVRPMQSFAL